MSSLPETSINGENPPSHSEIDDLDEYCLALLTQLTSPVLTWKVKVILELQQTFEQQYQQVTAFGLNHPSNLSTARLLDITKALILKKWFDFNTSESHFNLEIHLRCVVASLRLLSAREITKGSGNLSYELFKDMCRAMARWKSCHDGQVTIPATTGPRIKNYNNEFLIVYSQDLIATFPNDRTITANIASRAIASAEALAYGYSHNIVEAFKSLMTAVNFTRTPSSWHTKFRTMDDVSQLIRCSAKQGRRTDENSQEVADKSEETFILSLIDILEIEFGKLGWSFTRTVLAPGADAFGRPTFSSRHHFVLGILDLLQQHIRETKSGKVVHEIMKAVLQIVQKSPSQSFIRTKAFEVLASASDLDLSNTMTLEVIESWPDSRAQRKTTATEEWEKVMDRVKDMNERRSKVQVPIVQYRRVLEKTSEDTAPSLKRLEEISKCTESLERSLKCSCETGDDTSEEDLYKMKCGHLISEAGWQKQRIRDTRCRLCKSEVEELGGKLPMEIIRQDMGAIKECCDRLKAVLSWDGSGTEASWTHQLQAMGLDISAAMADDDSLRDDTPLIDVDVTENEVDLPRRNSSSSQITTTTIARCSTVVLNPPQFRSQPVLCEVASFPTPTSLKTRAFGPIKLVEKQTKFEDTAISTTGLAVALIEKSSFQVFSIRPDGPIKSQKDFSLVCNGSPIRKPSVGSRNGATLSTYHRIALNDDVLFIACDDGHIDVHNAGTGQQIYKIEPHKNCHNLLISPNGKVLAVEVHFGAVLCYPVGAEGRFDTIPIMLPNVDDGTSCGQLACMAFSPNSENISVCSTDNVIRTYSINVESCSSIEISRCAWELSPQSHRIGHGITGVTLFVPHLPLLIPSTRDSTSVVAVAKEAAPLHIQNATFLKNPEPRLLRETYKDTCRIAYSPVYCAALMLNRNGMLGLASFPTGLLIPLSKMKKLDSVNWKHCSLGFSRDGMLGLAVDQSGTLSGVRISA